MSFLLNFVDEGDLNVRDDSHIECVNLEERYIEREELCTDMDFYGLSWRNFL